MNELAHLQEFESLLANYKPSKLSLQTLSQTRLVLLVAPTSSGRNHIIRELLKTGDYYYIVSDTTRQPRSNNGIMEQDGVEYWFHDEATMLRDIQSGNYLEAAVIHRQQVSGISIRELQKATNLQKIAITDAEIAGLNNAISLKPDTVGIFVLPPSFEEWQRRLRSRGAMSDTEYQRRMASAASELREALSNPNYSFVINDDILQAVTEINSIAKLDIVDQDQQAAGRQVAEQLLIETETLLKSFA